MCDLLFVSWDTYEIGTEVVWTDASSSIISPLDGSLPKKPCKTCRNRFHAGCLYKVCYIFVALALSC